MELPVFKAGLSNTKPPANISIYLEALWYDAKGDWNSAHKLVQDVDDETAAWIHAYLHRKEHDPVNADYWYRRAGKQRPSSSLQKEWEQIVGALL